MIEHYLIQASTYAANVDFVINLVGVLVGFWGLLTAGIFFWLLFKFRARDGVRSQWITGEEKEQKRFISIPHYLIMACDVLIIVAAIQVWVDVKQRLPEEPHATVRVIGQQWAWSFVHPGPDGKLDTADDIETVDELHIEVDQPYIYELTSRDVLHNFSVPVFRLKQDAIPGRVITGWFEATKTGTYDIQCAEICGIGHGLMPARIVIESAAEHTAWMADRASSRVAAAGAAPALVAASTGAVSAN
jgi:cytochrome c oxidase subunit 2